jgi:DNA repair protein RecO (recombination protein O)
MALLPAAIFRPMAPVSTPALVLHAFPFGETSKIVRLLTREHGMVSAMAKGARQPKSRFGARLQVMSEGTAQLYLKQNRDLHTLADFDVTEQHAGLSHDVSRYVAAAALCEVILRFSPAEPHLEVFEIAVEGLVHLESVPVDRIGTVSLALLWSAVAALGFTPRMDACARDGRGLPDGPAAFSVAEGGFLCARCAPSAAKTVLPVADREVLERLISGDWTSVAPLPPRRETAHRRLLVRFVERHVAEGRELKALELWQELP